MTKDKLIAKMKMHTLEQGLDHRREDCIYGEDAEEVLQRLMKLAEDSNEDE